MAPTDPTNAADKAEELWRRDYLLDNADPLEVPGWFRRAIEDGDEVTFRAILGAPRWLNLLPDDVRAEGERAWAVAHSPERARELADLERARRGLERTLGTLRKAILTEAGVEVDAVAVVAQF